MIPDLRTLISLNLAVQLLLAIALAASLGLAKRRMLKRHCAVMRLAMPVQLLAILAVMLPAMVDIRDKALILLLFKTGIRKNELISLDIDSINWKDQSLNLKHTKKRSNRKVFFDDEAGYFLRRWLEVRAVRKGASVPALFTSSRGVRIHRGSADKIIRKAALHVGLHNLDSARMEDHFSAHACRHWFTTYLPKYLQWRCILARNGGLFCTFGVLPSSLMKVTDD